MSVGQRALGVAVVGLGIGEQHARAYFRNGSCALKWLYDLDADRSRRLAGELGSGRPAVDYRQILDDPETGLVSIASHDDVHAEQVVAALNAGKHVFVEKPLCRSKGELDRVRSAWSAERTAHLRSNLILRAAPLYRWLKEAVDRGDLGDLYAVDGDYLYGRMEKITQGWRREVEDYSVMLGGGIHLVDLMLWLTGRLPNHVTAVGNGIATSGTGFGSFDHVAATYEFDGGLVGRITANFGCVHRHQHVLRVFGTRGTFIYDDAGARLHLTRDPSSSPTPVEQSPLAATKGDLIPPLVTDILEGKGGEEAARREFDLIQTCISADESLKESGKVSIRYGN